MHIITALKLRYECVLHASTIDRYHAYTNTNGTILRRVRSGAWRGVNEPASAKKRFA